MKQKYILLVMVFVLSLPMIAQNILDGYTPIPMGSTSGLMSSGTTLPQSAETGVTLAGNSPGEFNTNASMAPSRPRRGVIDDGDWWDDPAKAPIGSLPFLLMLLLCGVYVVVKKRKQSNLA